MKKYVVLVVFVAVFGFALTTFAESPAFGYQRDLQVGSAGGDVTNLQIFLEGKGFLTMPVGVARGYFGPATKAAVIRYQIANGITPASGIVGSLTRGKLNRDENTTTFFKIISPNGGETWSIGSVEKISWGAIVPVRYGNPITANLPDSPEGFSVPANLKVDIYLSQDIPCAPRPGYVCPLIAYRPDYVLDKNISFNGSYHWIVGTDIDDEPIPEGRYFMKVCEAGSYDRCDYSDSYFDLVTGVRDSVTVLTPNGGESWEINTDKTISWRSTNSGAKFDLWLERNICEVGPNVACPAIYFEPILLDRNISGNSYGWIAGTDMENNPISPGRYKIKVCFTRGDVYICDTSDTSFALTEGEPLRVISPNGGEVLRAGKSYTIRWVSSQQTDEDEISLTVGPYQPPCLVSPGQMIPCDISSVIEPYLLDKDVSNTGSYRFRVPRNVETGQYSVKISGWDWSGGNGQYFLDNSDAPFTIRAN